jgi:hypothetical protein
MYCLLSSQTYCHALQLNCLASHLCFLETLSSNSCFTFSGDAYVNVCVYYYVNLHAVYLKDDDCVSLVSREAKEHFCVDYFTIVLKVHWLYAGFWEHPQRRSGQESTSSETGMSIHTGNHKVFHELCRTWIHRVSTSFLYVHLHSFLYACKT